MSDVTSALLEYGSMGIFAAFLVWQHLSMQKRLDTLVKGFQDQLDTIKAKYDEKESSLRDRYENVISGLQDEKSSFRVDVKGSIDASIRKVEYIDKKMEELKVQVESMTVMIRDSNNHTVKTFEILKKMQEEQKLREMARKMQGEDTPTWERR